MEDAPDFDPADEFPERPQPKSGGRRWFLAVLVAMAVGGGVLAWQNSRPETSAIPNLAGMRQGVAINELGPFEFVPNEEFSETVEAGSVIRTEPSAGTVLEHGKTVTIFVSTGPAPRVLPELVGLTFAEATKQLTDLGLVPIRGEAAFDETVVPEVVLSWTVPAAPTLKAGATVIKGTTVQLVASAGPAPRVVPDLALASLTDATAALKALALGIAQGPDEFDNNVPAGLVIRQDVPAGSSVKRGSIVTVVLSKGADLVALPDLAGLNSDAATAALSAAGFGVNTTTGFGLLPVVSVSVAGSPATAGQLFLRGTNVDLLFPTL